MRVWINTRNDWLRGGEEKKNSRANRTYLTTFMVKATIVVFES